MGPLRVLVVCAGVLFLTCSPFSGSDKAGTPSPSPGDDGGATTDDGSVEGGVAESGTTTPLPPYALAVLADKPLLYLRLEEMSGGTVSSDGTIKSATVYGSILGQAGKVGLAAGFGATGARIEVTDTLLDFKGTSSYTLEMWANIVVPKDADFHHLIVKDTTDASRQEYGLLVHNGTLVFERIVNNASINLGVPAPTDNQWHHVASVFDGSQMTLYLDGKVADGPKGDTRSAGPKSLPFTIGSKTATYGALPGKLDEVAVYDHALDANHLASHIAAAPP